MTAAPAAAQELSIWVDAAAARTTPPAGVAGGPASYGLLGARVQAELERLSLLGGGRAGRGLEAGGAVWLEGEASATVSGRAGAVGLAGELGGFGLRYSEPFVFRARGLDVRPRATLSLGATTWTVGPRMVAGDWSTEAAAGNLWVAGGRLEARRRLGALDAAAGLEALDVANGRIAGAILRASASAGLVRGRWAAAGEVAAQHGPLDDEVAAVVRVALEVSPMVTVMVDGGRFATDPLFGTPGTAGASVTVSVRPLRLRAVGAPPVVTVGPRTAAGRQVRFTLRAPDAAEVQITGDFTRWEPVPMRPQGDRWTVTLALPPGLHHFGFLVDGSWAVPPDAPGRVDDGWGRINASLVIEP